VVDPRADPRPRTRGAAAASLPGRLREIAAALGPFAGQALLDDARRLGLVGGEVGGRGDSLCRGLEALGPVFIKLGQLLSTRPDIMSADNMQALQRLQSRVAPMERAEVKATLDEHAAVLSGSPFEHVDLEPIACASLAQVHRGVLRDGGEVAIKLRRRGVLPRIELDLAVLQLMARGAERLVDAEVYDLQTTVEELAQALREEVDLRSEAENLLVFGRNLRRWSPSLRVPEVREELTTGSVLVMELVRGRPLGDGGADNLRGADRATLARTLAHAYFQMFFIDGVFHADPHPGNILVDEAGSLVLLDFGMVGRIERQVSDNLVRVLLNFQLKDSHGVAHAFLDLGKPTARADEVGWIMDVRRLLPRYHGMRLERLNVGTLLVDLLRNAARNGIQAPPIVALVCKSLANMDGSARLVDPTTDVVGAFDSFLPTLLEMHARRVASIQDTAKVALDVYIGAQRIPFQIATILEKAATGRLRVVVDTLKR